MPELPAPPPEHRPPAAGPTVGLCMIVRDEAAVIERCLASVRPLLSTWTIVDTGSADDTPARVEAALAGIPGTLHRRPWVDFGHNRSELMALARGTADLLLLLDADMTLDVRGPLPEEVAADAYLLTHAGDLDYRVPRLVRGSLPWRFAGATHEHLALDAPFAQAPLDALAVVHHADGGARADKLERDRRLLERTLAAAPDDPRATFYLAQTLRDLGERAAARALFARRAALGGWEEEAFYAAYQAALLTAEEDPVAGARLLLGAHARRPTRAEPLYDLARIAREQGWHATAYAAAQRGLAVPYPPDVLFVHRDVYAWALRFELSIAAWRLGRPDESLRLCDRLLADGRLPAAHAEATRTNREHALAAGAEETARSRTARLLAELAGEVEIGEIRLDVEPDWPQYNPSIARDGDGFRAVVRTANYRLEPDGYRFPEGGRQVRTLNYLVRLDGELRVTGVAPLVDAAPGPPPVHDAVVGLEDVRLVRAGGRWRALATVCDRDPDGRAQMALLQLDGATVTRLDVLPGPAWHEKNWVPFADDGEGLRLLYSCGPTVVLDCDPDTGAVLRRWEAPAPDGAAALRGGSAGVPVPGGHLFVVHEVHPGPVLGRCYVHRFVLVDEALTLAAATPAFTFTGADVEFCAGLARDGERLLLTFGVGDRRAHLAVARLDDVRAALRPAAATLAP